MIRNLGSKFLPFYVCLIVTMAVAWPALPAAESGTIHAQSGEVGEPVNLSNTTGKSWLPDIAADSAGNLHAVWTEEYLPSDDDGQWGDAILYTMWDGQAWTEPRDILVVRSNLSPDGLADSHLPAIAVDSKGLLHVTWTDIKNTCYSHAWAQAAPWSARSWSSPLVISNGRPTYFSDLAVDSHDNVHAVWVKASLEDRMIDQLLCRFCDDIFYAHSTDGGVNWSDPVDISKSPERANRPRLTVDNQDHLHVVWESVNVNDHGLGIGYERSADGGQTWSGLADLNADIGADRPSNATVAADRAGRVHVMWFGLSGGYTKSMPRLCRMSVEYLHSENESK